MPKPNDQDFQAYLKRFRPRPAEPLKPGKRHGWMALAACAAVLLLAALIATHRYGNAGRHSLPASARSERIVIPVPLTLGRANELLARSPSARVAFDRLAFERNALRLPKGTESALAVLGKEDSLL